MIYSYLFQFHTVHRTATSPPSPKPDTAQAGRSFGSGSPARGWGGVSPPGPLSREAWLLSHLSAALCNLSKSHVCKIFCIISGEFLGDF